MKKGYIELSGVIGAIIVSVVLIYKGEAQLGACLCTLVLGYVFGTVKNVIKEFRDTKAHKIIYGW